MTVVAHRPLPRPPARPLGGTETTPWSDQAAARILWATIDELTIRFGDRYAESRIIGVAIGAMRDLRGSAAIDALPELISRLVRVRLLSDGTEGGPADRTADVEPGPRPHRKG